MFRKFAISVALILALLALPLAGCAEQPAGPSSAAPTNVQATATPTAQTPTPTPAAPTPSPTASARPAKDFLEHIDFQSKLLEQNLVQEPTRRQLFVLLPPSYFDSDRRYPVVYYFSGFGMSAGSFIPSARDRLLASMRKQNSEYIVVEVDGNSSLGGSFLVNSPVTGNWEDYVIQEIVPFIDGKYRTQADVTNRGIAGFSMGGFAALNLAMRHPDVFCATYAICPGLMADGGLAEALGTWDVGFLSAYGKAFCPLPDVPDTLTAIPKMDASKKDNEIVKKWESGFGDLAGKVDAYLALNKKLKAIAVEYGTTDQYTWIPKGCEAFSQLLDEKGIAHITKPFQGGHAVPPWFSDTQMTAFFGAAFAQGN